MITPVNSAPPAFMTRYNAVMSGEEKLDTVQKLKDFWLFGIEQGWPHPEMREYMAELMLDVWHKNRVSFDFEKHGVLFGIALDLEADTMIGGMGNEKLDEELYDRAWRYLQYSVEFIDKAYS